MDKYIKLKKKRIDNIKKMYQSYSFDGSIYLFGYGAVGRPLLYMLIKIIKLNTSNIIIIDKEDKRDEIEYFLRMGVKFVHSQINKYTYKKLLEKINTDDIIIDCAYNIYTLEIIQFCQEKKCHYINSCIEDWDYKIISDPIKYSLYNKHVELKKYNDCLEKKYYNAILSMGCNPGNVSIWTKLGLEKINEKYKHTYKSYAELAKKLGVQVIHISERDTQITYRPKKRNEYCNTWSTDGESYYEEALGCVELSWGTHERILPNDIKILEDHFMIIDRLGITTYAQSVVPIYGNFIGNIIRHDEAHTIGKTLEYKENNKIIYKPSVYYVYHPSDATKISLDEFKEKDFEYQKNYRLMTDEIIHGRDILGLTFFLENKEVYFIGSILSIDEAREIFNYEFNEWVNATNVQVMAGYLAGVLHLIDLLKNKEYNGLIIPDELPHHKIFNLNKNFLGEFIFKKIDNFKLIKYSKKFTDKQSLIDDWQFENFIV